jgi:mono/diheme cytochrome c family protein
MEQQLGAIKIALFALLAALLLVLSGAIFFELDKKPDEPRFWCGNTNPAALSAKYGPGKELFVANCASCHNKNMRDNLTGPALGPALAAWSKYPRKDLYNYIRDSQKMLRKRHPRAVKIWKEYQPTLMNAFPGLTDQQIEDLLEYIEKAYQPSY